jgi:hypothetical protein
LFCGLLDDAFSNSEYVPSNSRVMNKWNGCGSDDDFVRDSILMIAWKDLGKLQKTTG